MIRKLDDKSMSQGKNKNISKETQQGITYSTIFFFIKPKEDLTGGTMAAKTSLPLCDRSGVADTGAPEELKLDGRLLQENKSKVRTKRGIQQKKKQENNSPAGDKGCIIILFFLILRHGNHSTI